MHRRVRNTANPIGQCSSDRVTGFLSSDLSSGFSAKCRWFTFCHNASVNMYKSCMQQQATKTSNCCRTASRLLQTACFAGGRVNLQSESASVRDVMRCDVRIRSQKDDCNGKAEPKEPQYQECCWCCCCWCCCCSCCRRHTGKPALPAKITQRLMISQRLF